VTKGELKVTIIEFANKQPGAPEADSPVRRLPLTRKQRHDTHDIDRRELKLIRVGHYLWALGKKECGKSQPLRESGPIWDALQTVWNLKVELRKALKVERAALSLIARERFKLLKAA
jgi:hypothetical protein